LTMRFRGREIIYAEAAMEMLFEVARQLQDAASIRAHPSLEGRNMSMVLVPKTQKGDGKSPEQEQEQEEQES
jgi:translation initiation factor IF-3